MDRLEQIFEMQRSLNQRVGVNTDSMSDEEKVQWTLNYSRAMSQEIAELVDSVPWKWWAKYQEFNKQNVRVEIVDLFHFLVSLAQVNGMTAEDLYEVYLKKNAVNIKRQDQGYSVKDELDNQNL